MLLNWYLKRTYFLSVSLVSFNIYCFICKKEWSYNVAVARCRLSLKYQNYGCAVGRQPQLAAARVVRWSSSASRGKTCCGQRGGGGAANRPWLSISALRSTIVRIHGAPGWPLATHNQPSRHYVSLVLRHWPNDWSAISNDSFRSWLDYLVLSMSM